ncbi:MAG: DUF4279 domain-containing protein [Sedimentisphaerales bacterium]|nr:DUF4279 domain-containing protein [Sedimentisphaerales bacterium]
MTSKKKSKRIKEYEWRYVSLTLRGKNLDPVKMTQILGVNPNKWVMRGEPLGSNNKKKCKQGLWILESGPPTWRFETKLKKILNKIEPIKHRLRKLIEENNDIQRAYLDIAVMPPEDCLIAGYSFRADLLNEFTSLGIDVELSIHVLADFKKYFIKGKRNVIKNCKNFEKERND